MNALNELDAVLSTVSRIWEGDDCGTNAWPEEILGAGGRGHRHTRFGEILVAEPVFPLLSVGQAGRPENRYLISNKLGFGSYASTWFCKPLMPVAMAPWIVECDFSIIFMSIRLMNMQQTSIHCGQDIS